MANPHFPRSRSPVLSIRTQPEDEDRMIAAIREANRTQQERKIQIPRQSAYAKRDSKHASRRTGPSILAKDLPPSQLARSFAVNNNNDDNDDYDRPSLLPATFTTHTDMSGQTNSESKRPWRRFTQRYANLDFTKSFSKESTVGSTKEKSRNKGVKIPKRNDEVTTANDQEAREAQAERLEEQNTLPDLTQSLQPKTKRALRKSVYGSLSGTRNFFRSTPKSPHDKLCSLPTPDSTVPPHVWSFERKDLLQEYLNNTSADSPVSPSVRVPHFVDVAKDTEPVELSADTSLVELEGNCTKNVADLGPEMLRTSTPSNGDLPPYIDDKKFHTDVAKDSTLGEPPGRSSEDMAELSNAKYTCGSCKKVIRENEVWDFCVICDVRDWVICIDCGQKGPGCQHELEQLLRNCAISETATLPHRIRDNMAQPQQVRERKSITDKTYEREDNSPSADIQHRHLDFLRNRQMFPCQTLPENTLDTRQQMTAEIRNMQPGFLKEMDHLRVREQDLVYRERELSLRAREIDVRDQQATLREREVTMQQRSDQLLRSYQVLACYQERTRGSQPKSSYATTEADRSHDMPEISYQNCVNEKKMAKPVQGQHQEEVEAANSKSNLDAEVPTLNVASDGLYVRSHAGPKRKKDSNNASTTSTPNAVSSPDQLRKAPSRGSSERGADQEDDEDEEGHRLPKRPKQDPSSPDSPQRLFACPFSKHNPLRFSSRNMEEKNYRGCVGHFLTDVSRLKQHLKRVHWQPDTYCPRCYEEFDDSTKLFEHARALVACVARDCPFPEKMDKSKQEKIHVKRPRVPPVTVWYDIYKVLFPGDPLPDSPYVERDDPIVTPSSATPQLSVNSQAMQQLNESFTRKLNQHRELQNSPLQPVIRQALADSFNELLVAFSLSPTVSPGGAGPSIIVSPVSRSPSDIIQSTDSPPAVFTRPPTMERRRSVTNIVSGPQKVPTLQKPGPLTKTALQVPPEQLGRSSSSQRRWDLPSSAGPAEVIFNVSIPSHVQDDQGYGDECHSFEQGDDRQAMASVNEPAPPPSRNKSVISIDSGYGSGRSQQHPAIETSKLAFLDRNFAASSSSSSFDNYNTRGEASTFEHQEQPLYATQDPIHPSSHQDQCDNFESYSKYLDPSFQAEWLSGIELPFMEQNNPWSSMG